MRRLLPLAVSMVLAGAATAAPDSDPQAFAPVVVEVRVNDQVDASTLIVRRDSDGTLLLRPEDLAQLRIRMPARGWLTVDGERYVRVGAEMGAHVTFDDATQSARITLPPSAFTVSHNSALAPDVPQVTPASLGGFANYDFYGEQANRETRAGAFLDFGVFGSHGVVTSSLVGRHDDDGEGAVRLDTTWTKDFPDRLTTLRIGDSISASGAWGRSARFGGVQFGTNFSTQPTLVTMPLLSAQGEAIVPSTVDVFVNGRRVASEDVPPGPFSIDRLPPITGSGQMQVVVTDALGRQQVVSQPYYTGQTLLRAGLSEYSFEAGAIREDYGLRSNAYGSLVVAGTFRRGITDRFTAEVHTEAQAGGATAAGLDAAWQIADIGIVSISAAGGGDGSLGFLTGAGFEHNGQAVSVFVRAQYASENFAQLGTDVPDGRPKLLSFGGVGTDLGRWGSLQASFGRQSYWRGPSSQTVALGHSVELGGWGFLNFIASRSTGGDTSTDLFLNWTRPFGDRRNASMSLRHSPDVVYGEKTVAVATVQQALPAGSGTGYYASLSSNDEAQIDYVVQGHAGLLGVQYARRNGSDGWRANASGGLAMTSAGIMTARRLDQSFAIVQVADYPDLTVYVENQPVGRTDGKGRVLLDSLRAYESNGVSIDPTELPMDATLAMPATSITPAYRSGPVVRFPVVRASAATLHLILPDGSPVPAGALVTTGSEQAPVAMDGLVYLANAAGRHAASASWAGHRCEFRIARPEGGDLQPDLGNIVCTATGADRVTPPSGK